MHPFQNTKWLLATIALATLTACSPKTNAPEPIRSVRTQVVALADTVAAQQFAAEIRARNESRLAFRVPGKIVSRQVEVGQSVRSGQVLARIDGRDLALAEQAAQAGVSSARASLELAEAEFRRFKDLQAQGFISAWELERRETALRAARAQTQQVVAQAHVQGNQSAYSALVADMAGVVLAADAEPGMVVAAGTPVIRLAHDGPRDAVFAVPEDKVSAMRGLLGKTGAIQVLPWGEGAAAVPATVREIAPAADPATRTFTVKADLGKAALRLGQTASAQLRGAPVPAIKLPLPAVFEWQGKPAVWLLDPQALTLRRQAVQVTAADGNEAVVAAGLKPGDEVVTAGVHVLAEGQKVRRWSAGPSTPAAAGSPTPAAAASR